MFRMTCFLVFSQRTWVCVAFCATSDRAYIWFLKNMKILIKISVYFTVYNSLIILNLYFYYFHVLIILEIPNGLSSKGKWTDDKKENEFQLKICVLKSYEIWFFQVRVLLFTFGLKIFWTFLYFGGCLESACAIYCFTCW